MMARVKQPSKALPHFLQYLKDHPNRYLSRKVGRFINKFNIGFKQINTIENVEVREEMRQLFYEKYRKESEKFSVFFTTEISKQDFNNVFLYHYREHLRDSREVDEIIESIEELDFIE